METKRITVSVPTYIYKQAKKMVKDRELSSFVADAIQEKVINTRIKEKTDPVEVFMNLRKKYPHKLSTKQILANISKGRA